MCLKCKFDYTDNFFESNEEFFLSMKNNDVFIKKMKNNETSSLIYNSYLFNIKYNNGKIIFQLIWNKKENTYCLHNLTSKVYETDIIANPFNDDIILGNNLVEYLFINKPTYKPFHIINKNSIKLPSIII